MDVVDRNIDLIARFSAMIAGTVISIFDLLFLSSLKFQLLEEQAYYLYPRSCLVSGICFSLFCHSSNYSTTIYSRATNSL